MRQREVVYGWKEVEGMARKEGMGIDGWNKETGMQEGGGEGSMDGWVRRRLGDGETRQWKVGTDGRGEG